jgi:tripartite ATP-independent transporter DctM subunit
MLIVMGPVLGVSVADLYAAAFGPGFMLAGMYVIYLIVRSILNPKLGPPVPKEERVTDPVAIIREVIIGVVPLAALIGATLGSILGGLATPTEAAGIGALGALILAVAYRRFTFATLKQAVISATLTSSMVLLLAVTSNVFGAVFARLGTATWITDYMTSLPVPPLAMLGIVIFLLFLLGWPFEWPAIILVFLPIFYPVVDALKPALSQQFGIPPDLFLVWFGALVAVTMQTAYLSPPVAMSAYYLKQVVKEWSLGTIYKGMFEFMVIQCIAIAVVIFFPAIATWFPEHLNKQQQAVETEQVDDSMNRLEEDPTKTMMDQQEEEEEKKGADSPDKGETKK